MLKSIISSFRNGEIKEGAIAEVTINSCMQGKAKIERIQDDGVKVKWLDYCCCYPCQSVPSETMFLGSKLFERDLVDVTFV